MQLKEIFEKNGYDNKFFDKCLRTFLNKIYSKKVPQYTVLKKDLYIFLPYLGKLSLSARSTSQPAFTCSKSTIETLEQGVKYVQS